jgi:hypothetical protein
MNDLQFWIAVAAGDHVEASVAGGYVEINHGKRGPLARMRPGDGIACYSPRRSYPDGARLQCFTALGRVTAAPIVQLPASHQPFRREVAWLACSPAPIRPLLEELTFVHHLDHWGAAFRFGFLRVPPDDFLRIARAMACAFDAHAPATPSTTDGVAFHPAGRRAGQGVEAAP